MSNMCLTNIHNNKINMSEITKG